MGDLGAPIMGKLICIKKCDLCGKDVEIHHKERLTHKNIFCSHKCEGEYRKLNNPNYIRCVYCGKLTPKKPYQQKKSKTNMLCCSRKCLGELRKIIYQGESNPNYGNAGVNSPLHKNDTRISVHGYRLIALSEPHPFAINGFWIKEHRYLAEKYLMTDDQAVIIDGKKYLNPIYDVHHIDHNRLNNDLSNLQIMTRSEHSKLHGEEKRQARLSAEQIQTLCTV